MERSTSRDNLSVAATRLPMGARKRSKSWPDETRGNISLPRYGPTRTMTASEAAAYSETTMRRFRVDLSRILPSLSRHLARREGAPFSSSGTWARRIHVESSRTSEVDNRYEEAVGKPTANVAEINRE